MARKKNTFLLSFNHSSSIIVYINRPVSFQTALKYASKIKKPGLSCVLNTGAHSSVESDYPELTFDGNIVYSENIK